MGSRVPILRNPHPVVRTAVTREEKEAANRLVFENYVADGFWRDDEQDLQANGFLAAPSRTVFVVLEGGRVQGTMSVISDSPLGLPSDGTQAAPMRKLRASGDKLAEVSAFAMDRSRTAHRRLACLLMSFMYQYSFYHLGIDRLVASCKPAHAAFYQSVLCFSRVSDLTYYDYSNAAGYLITLDLLEAHRLFSEKYPADPATGRSLYRFFLCDPQPGQQFPDRPLKRSRQTDWVASVRKVA